MLNMGARILGLDIGSTYIKWIVYKESIKSPVVCAWGHTFTPPGAVRCGEILRKEELREKLDEIIRSNKLDVTKASITLSCPEMVIKVKELPLLKNREIKEVTRFEIRMMGPSNAGEYITDYRILEKVYSKGVRLLRVMMASVPARIIQPYIQLIRDLDMKPAVLDVHSNSAARFLSRYRPACTKDCYLLADIGAETTTVAAVKGSVPLFSRVLAEGLRDMPGASGGSFDSTQLYRFIQSYQRSNSTLARSIIVIGGGSYAGEPGDIIASQPGLSRIFLDEDIVFNKNPGMEAAQIPLYANVLGLAFRGGR